MGDLRGYGFLVLPVYLVLSFLIVAFEESDRYIEAAAVYAHRLRRYAQKQPG